MVKLCVNIIYSLWQCDFLLIFFLKSSISKQQKSQAWWFQHYSLINWQHWNNDFYDNQTMCKPKIKLCKPKSVMCKLLSFICKPRNLGDSEEFLQGSLCPHLIFTGLIRSPHSWFNQWMSLFLVKIKFAWFAPVYIPLPPDGFST